MLESFKMKITLVCLYFEKFLLDSVKYFNIFISLMLLDF